MKAYYLVALFAIVAVANAGSDYSTEDSKTQDQFADGTQSQINDNNGNAVGANELGKGAANILSSDSQNADVGQGQHMS